MEIITQNYESLLKEMIINNFNHLINKNVHRNDSKNKVFNYIDILSNIDDAMCSIAKKSIITIFNSIDNGFKVSTERKSKYHIKAHHKRSIMTIFGEITFKRTFYTDKFNKGSFCYLDNYLGLKKHDYFDPYIKALVLDKAANNSASKVADYINNLIGNRVKITDPFNYISKQTIRNIILESELSNINPKELTTPETLYVMADEKFISVQNNNMKKIMVKSIVTFDGIKTINNRKCLKNKNIFATFSKKGPANDTLDYLNQIYNLEKIKNIFVMGDGAGWIKNLAPEFRITKDTNVIYALDKFHFKQAVHHLCMHEEIEKIIKHYVRKNMKKDFINVCEALTQRSPHRKETIENKRDYIINNWRYINNLYNYNLTCPMESQISHNIADLFTSRPKAYSIKTLKKLIPLRLLFKNKKNIKDLYLNNYNKKQILTINEKELNFSMFEQKDINIKYLNLKTKANIYNTKIYD
ncbi:MAG: UPF0236 family protein [Bacilli bacterium]